MAVFNKVKKQYRFLIKPALRFGGQGMTKKLTFNVERLTLHFFRVLDV